MFLMTHGRSVDRRAQYRLQCRVCLILGTTKKGAYYEERPTCDARPAAIPLALQQADAGFFVRLNNRASSYSSSSS